MRDNLILEDNCLGLEQIFSERNYRKYKYSEDNYINKIWNFKENLKNAATFFLHIFWLFFIFCL